MFTISADLGLVVYMARWICRPALVRVIGGNWRWSVDDFIMCLAPPPCWKSSNRAPSGTPNGAISAGAAISNQGLNGGSAKILLAPSLNGGSRHNKPSLTISNHLVPFLLSYWTVSSYCIGSNFQVFEYILSKIKKVTFFRKKEY